MIPPKPSVSPIPASALFHFALAQDEYVGVLNACQYFAKNLKDAKSKETMERALGRLNSPTGLSVQSEEKAEVSTINESAVATVVGEEDSRPAGQNKGTGSSPRTSQDVKRGISALGGKKK